MDHLPTLEDDGLVTPEVGDWAEDKYQLIKCYATIFSNSMSGKWGSLVYMDLFAGAGHARIRESSRIIPASPLVALDIPKPFSKYIFAELDETKVSALIQRAKSSAPNQDVVVLQGDCNERAGDLAAAIPNLKGPGVLTFCFVDPYKLASLRFSTIERLAYNRKIDFLILLPSRMDAHRNEETYIKEGSNTVANFIGSADWRTRWQTSPLDFGDFVADEFGKSMARIGYLYEGTKDMKLIRSTEKNLPLYHLGFFSKNALGTKFWKECQKYTNPQRSLF
jgi:three-Cys-motif partner protein